jgi:hypothetical protein
MPEYTFAVRNSIASAADNEHERIQQTIPALSFSRFFLKSIVVILLLCSNLICTFYIKYDKALLRQIAIDLLLII